MVAEDMNKRKGKRRCKTRLEEEVGGQAKDRGHADEGEEEN